MDIKELLWRSCIGHKECAELLGVTERTVQNWIRYGGPHWACERLSLIAGVHPDWYGISLLAGELVLPNGELLTKQEIEAIPYQRSLFNQMSTLVRSTKAETKALLDLANASNDEKTENIYLDPAFRFPRR